MSISALLNPTPPPASYLDIYCNSITSNIPITNSNFSYIECLNSVAQGLPGAAGGFPRNFDTIINQSNFPGPIGNIIFKPSLAGYYKCSFSISFRNTSGVALNNTKFSAFITKNNAVFYYEPSVITTNLPNNEILSLTASYVIKFDGVNDFIACDAANSNVLPVSTGDSSVNLLQNKISIHYLHD